MKKNFIITGVIVALLVIAAIAVIAIRNNLVSLDEEVSEQWSQIDTQLQRRADLVPNLVNTVKGYAAHEKEIFTAAAEARSALLAAQGPESKAAASEQVASALGRLLAIAEKYPELKADPTFHRLMDELAGTENRIAVARGRYNNAVRDYNQAIRQFPGSFFAPGMGMQTKEYFNPPAGRSAVEKVPEVKF